MNYKQRVDMHIEFFKRYPLQRYVMLWFSMLGILYAVHDFFDFKYSASLDYALATILLAIEILTTKRIKTDDKTK